MRFFIDGVDVYELLSEKGKRIFERTVKKRKRGKISIGFILEEIFGDSSRFSGVKICISHFDRKTKSYKVHYVFAKRGKNDKLCWLNDCMYINEIGDYEIHVL